MYCLPLEEIEIAVKEVKPDPNVIDLRVNKDADVINITKQELVVTKLPEQESSSKFDINTAKLENLITVKGIGQKTAEKIIENRPYNELNELTKALSSTAIKNIDLSKLQC
jgi:DNA uptake protein ComE-like DNA-binding protein